MKGTLLVLLLISSLERPLSARSTPPAYGPYEFVWKYAEDCGNEESLVHFHVKSRKVSRTKTVAEGYIIIKNVTINDDIRLRLVVEKFTSNGWKDNDFVYDSGNTGICEVLKTYLHAEDAERIVSGVRDRNNNSMPICNVPPEEYTVSGVEFNLFTSIKNLPPAYFYGQYRNKIRGYHMNSTHELGCVSFHFDVVPKKRNG